MLENILCNTLIVLIFFTFGKCMRPNPLSQDQSSNPENTGNQSTRPPATSATTGSHPSRPNPSYTATERMKPVTGLTDARYVAGQRHIKNSFGPKRLKGVSHTGVLGNSASGYNFPKLSFKAGRREGAIISHFHHPKEIQGQKPYEYMKDQQLDTRVDQAIHARTLPLGFRKHDQPDLYTLDTIKQWSENPKHPKASLAYMMPADPSANQKRPKVDVEGGRYYGHLVTLVYGPESPKGSNQPITPLSNTAAQASAQDNAFAQSLLRSRTPSPDGGESNKRRRIKDEPY